jgi:hypothetical protein
MELEGWFGVRGKDSGKRGSSPLFFDKRHEIHKN